jgi:tRNA U38,U39,U40 pseudouridine synthase TruA
MVGALLGVASGVINTQDLLFMLENPSDQNWNPRVSTASADGLFLKSVNYINVPVLRGPLS